MSRISDVRRGDLFDWQGIRIEIIRVAIDGRWADIRCSESVGGAEWTKRQPLPMPPGTHRIADGAL